MKNPDPLRPAHERGKTYNKLQLIETAGGWLSVGDLAKAQRTDTARV